MINLNKNLKNFILCILFIFLIFIITFKALNNTLTPDEAYTYLSYVYTGDYFNIGLANNHLLNTFLIGVTTIFGNSELLIRLPNLLSGFVYLLISIVLAKQSKQKILNFVLLTFCPYLIDYFSLARGYGLSSMLMFSSVVNYFFIKDYRYQFLVSINLLLLASFSIHIVIVYTLVFGFVNFLKEYSKDELLTKLALIELLLFSYFLIQITFQITSVGKPIFGASEINFKYLFTTFFGLLGLYNIQNIYFKIFVLIFLFYFPYVYFFRFNEKLKKLTIINILTLILYFLIPYILAKPYPVERILVPFLPVYLFITYKSLEFANKKILKIYWILIIILFFNFFSNLNLYGTLDWGESLEKNLFLTFNQTGIKCDFLLEATKQAEYYRINSDNTDIKYCLNN